MMIIALCVLAKLLTLAEPKPPIGEDEDVTEPGLKTTQTTTNSNNHSSDLFFVALPI